MKNVFKSLCECKMEIKGFSEKHLKKNLEIHKLLSREHKERMNILKKNPDTLFFYDLKDNEIEELLSKNSVIIEDIKCIGG